LLNTLGLLDRRRRLVSAYPPPRALFARVHRPYQLIKDETYWVDLHVPRFDILWGGEPVSVARAQLIASYVLEISEWLWGFENPGIPKAAAEELKAAMGRVPQLAELLAGRKWCATSLTGSPFAPAMRRCTQSIAGNTNTTAFPHRALFMDRQRSLLVRFGVGVARAPPGC
jgi:hypothetical protein